MKYLPALLLLAALSARSQTGRLEGYIYDTLTKEEIPFAKVWLANTSFATTSDIDGYFSFNDLPEGKYDLRVFYLAFDSVKWNVKIVSGKTSLLNISMKEQVWNVDPEPKAYPPAPAHVIPDSFLVSDRWIKKADSSYCRKDFKTAITQYTRALAYNPARWQPYAGNRIAECIRLTENAQSEYAIAIHIGDSYFSWKNYYYARRYYREASGMAPGKVYPKNQLARIEKLLKKQ